MLHHSEWLADAKKVPIGQKRRIFHGAERTRAMDIWNNEDSWSAYCHRCHESGKVYKEYLQKPVVAPVQHIKYLDKGSLVHPNALAVIDAQEYRRLVVFLQSKGVSLPVLRHLNPMFSTLDKRLVFQSQGVAVGRDITDTSAMKWYKYPVPEPRGFLYSQGRNAFSTHEPVVLCEDVFSCAKVWYYTGCSTMCLLGTNFEDAKVKFLLDKNAEVLIATDGDKGGWDAVKVIRSRCDLLGIPYMVLHVPDGCDPKDLKPKQLLELVR